MWSINNNRSGNSESIFHAHVDNFSYRILIIILA